MHQDMPMRSEHVAQAPDRHFYQVPSQQSARVISAEYQRYYPGAHLSDRRAVDEMPDQASERYLSARLADLERQCDIKSRSVDVQSRELKALFSGVADTQHELARYRDRIQNLEEAIEEFHQRNSGQQTLESTVADLKKDLRTLEQRVDTMLSGSLQAESRWSKAQDQLEARMVQLFEKHDAKIDRSVKQLETEMVRLNDQQTTNINSLRDDVLLPFLNVFQEVIVPSASGQQPRSEATGIQASAEAAAKVLRFIFRGLNSSMDSPSTGAASGYASREYSEPRQDSSQSSVNYGVRNSRPNPEQSSAWKRKRTTSFEQGMAQSPRRVVQHAHVTDTDRDARHSSALSVNDRRMDRYDHYSPTRSHSTPSVPTLNGAGSARALKATSEQRSSIAERDQRSLYAETSEADRVVRPVPPVHQHASKIRRISAVQDDLRDVLQEVDTNVPRRSSPEPLQASRNQQRDVDVESSSTQAVELNDSVKARQSLIEYLKDVRTAPSQAKVHDSFFLAARLCNWRGITSLVISENINVDYSLISEVLANALVKSGQAEKELADENEDEWIRVDLSWPYDAGKPFKRSDGEIAYFKDKEIRFLIVPQYEMDHGIVLVKKTLDQLALQVRFSKTHRRHFVARDGDIDMGALLDSFPQERLSMHLAEPFTRLCSLAEYAMPRKNPKKEKDPFFQRDRGREDSRRFDDIVRRADDTYWEISD